jgi:hypothetical protein
MVNNLDELAKFFKHFVENTEKKLLDIFVPPFAVGVKFIDFDLFYEIRNKDIKLSVPDSSVNYVQEGNWFRREDYNDKLSSIPKEKALLDPRTGYLLKDIKRIDNKVELWTASSGSQIPWMGGDSIGKLHTLQEQDYRRILNLSGKCKYFIRLGKGIKIELGKNEYVKNIVNVGDHLISVALCGDNCFTYQLLRPNPTSRYELRGVYCVSKNDGLEKAFTIDSYGLGQDVTPIKIELKRE